MDQIHHAAYVYGPKTITSPGTACQMKFSIHICKQFKLSAFKAMGCGSLRPDPFWLALLKFVDSAVYAWDSQDKRFPKCWETDQIRFCHAPLTFGITDAIKWTYWNNIDSTTSKEHIGGYVLENNNCILLTRIVRRGVRKSSCHYCNTADTIVDYNYIR